MYTGIKDYPLMSLSELEAEREREFLFNGALSCKDYRALMKDECGMCMEHWWSFTERKKSKYREEACPIATFSTTNPT